VGEGRARSASALPGARSEEISRRLAERIVYHKAKLAEERAAGDDPT
jgi:hypothetical protein